MRTAVAEAILSAFPHAARALDYPTRPVHWIIGLRLREQLWPFVKLDSVIRRQPGINMRLP
jgi:hypothetical protein